MDIFDREDNTRSSLYSPVQPSISLSVFNRIHSAVARAERRLLTDPDEIPPVQSPSPIRGDPFLRIMPELNAPRHRPRSPISGILPKTRAPIEFTCAICMEKVKKGSIQQILNCGHKFCCKCIETWISTKHESASCPTCRTPIQTVQQTPRFTPQQQALAFLLHGQRTT